MDSSVEIQLGSVVVKSLDGRRFHFQDVSNRDKYVTIEDADVADLLRFLYVYSNKARESVEVVERGTK